MTMSVDAPAQPIDRKEVLSQAFEALEAAPAPVQEATQPRDEGGKFAPKAAEAPVVETPAEPEEPVWSRPPASWKKDYHEPWGTVDPKVREYVWQREQEMSTGVEALKPKGKLADDFNKAIEPYLPTIQGLGMDPITAVKSLMDADYRLRTLPADQKRALIGQLAASYGVNLGDVEPQQQTTVDPTVYALQQQVTQLKGQFTGWTQAQQNAFDQSLVSEINEFAPQAELFEDAKPVMIQLLQSGLATGLEDAYQKAIRMDPELYEKAEHSLQADAEAQKRAQADKAAKAAKAAAVSVRSSSPGAQTPTKATDRRALLEEAFSNISERM